MNGANPSNFLRLCHTSAHTAGSRRLKRCSVPVMGEPLDTWFKREILSHEEILVRFISRVWPRRDEIADIRQESYARIYESARQTRPRAPKAFLFATARHLMADRIRRERIVSIRAGGENEYLNVLVDEISPEQRVGAHQELARLAQAFDRLSAKCREVMWLRRVQELPQKQVAERLGITEKTIEKHLRTGTRQLAHYMRENALPSGTSRNDVDEAWNDEAGGEHGTHQRD
jgi:RNA polymerase sigma factor (sigma-70 family)